MSILLNRGPFFFKPYYFSKDINGNQSQSILTSEIDCLDLSGSQELLNWNEATVPIGMLEEPITNPELLEPSSEVKLFETVLKIFDFKLFVAKFYRYHFRIKATVFG